MSNLLSVVIITKNEEHFIADAVKSALFADEVLVMDSGSSDNTSSIAAELGAKVIHQDWLGFGAQKNKAVSMTKNDWVFVLDADERITLKLKDEILSSIKSESYTGYYVPRKNFFFGEFIKYGGFYPDLSLRLFRKDFGTFNDVKVHESVKLVGESSTLQEPMIHIAYDNYTKFVEKQKKYAALSEKKKSFFKMFLSPIWTFLKIYIFRMGCLDGWRGLVIAIVYSKYTYLKYKK